jgi:hypothetical protein
LETQILIAKRLKFLEDDTAEARISELHKMLHVFAQKLKAR